MTAGLSYVMLSGMKLGEALNERSRLAKRVTELRDFLGESLVMQEGEEPVSDAGELIAQSLAAISEIEKLVAAINKTNANTTLADGRTLTQALAARDGLAAKVATYEYAMREIGGKNDPYAFRRSASELKQVRTMDLTVLMDSRDALAKERRELDAELQTLNWTTDLVD